MSCVSRTADLKQQAHHAGFELVGVSPAVTPTGVHRLADWLATGYAGQMQYLAARQDAYADLDRVLDGVRSVVMLGMNYANSPPRDVDVGQGRVSRYAWGEDYHDLIHARLAELASSLRASEPQARVRGVVDTAPLLEREFAQLAGLGWVGKNTMLINRSEGSWFFLAALLTDLELEYDDPEEEEYCGTCTACLEACPTGAFVEPYVLDARRCISYLTIELKTAIPLALREGLGDWLFGCDICQGVCPWNNHAATTAEPAFRPAADRDPVDLVALFDLDEADFRHRFRQTPLWRPRRRGILRNAAVLLGNRPHPTALSALIKGLNDKEPLVRGAAAWALGRYDEPPAREALLARRELEDDDEVRGEIDAALSD
ncbi:MAG: tRNA epoxyqueuosine(34) reductase QueG [Planctomycetota bacterium]|nr:MAG: tRNA epoxyqueuosine(34) reductase QueG [Planctomycetota bacterium]REJ98780.1 MAG: tRNA epoxyqueuosine(34) reductase QueG [Planctomycetota bacterium]REK27625.1 MAG: tRNA epoxyqueuosine(34) reductase QueG [Planctomycetota bacterium]REK43236.1 MAG: tRNA epoxyqueuosine(34) reductase QueG [Planctomycetota bacterium]